MPHFLASCFGKGDEGTAWRAFGEGVDEIGPHVTLYDTDSDKVDEALRAADALGESLESVRLDTTSSRRGDIRHIAQGER